MTTDADSFAMDFDPEDPENLGFRAKRDNLIDPPIIRIYLAGPLTNNDQNIERDCSIVRSIVKNTFAGYDFLGVRFEVYDPGDCTPPGSSHAAEDVYVQDFMSTVNADLVIFHVISPSLGVGMETQISAFATIPRLVISKAGSPVSRMFTGVFSPSVGEISYSDGVELLQKLNELLPTIAALAIESAEKRRPIIRSLMQQNLGRRLLKERILKGVSIQELARRTNIREFWLRRLETDPIFTANVSLAQLGRLGEELDFSPQVDGTTIKFKSQVEEDLPPHCRISLESLVTYAQGLTAGVNDERLFRVWEQYLQESREIENEAARFRGDPSTELTGEDWEKRYTDRGLF